MKKSSFVTIAITSMILAGAAFAAKAESKPGKCCAKAAADGKTCTHECCVKAAKDGNYCTKCGGTGKIEKKVEAKK